MAWYGYVIGSILIVASILIIILILMQESNTQGLSGAIAGGAENFFGKGKAKTLDAKLARMTKWFALAFVVLTLILNLVK